MTHPNSSFSSMKFRLWRRRMSVSSPRMRIRTELPWTWRLALGGAMLVLVAAAATWTYDFGRRLTDPEAVLAREQLEKYREQVERLSAEREKYSAMANAAESQINMERSAQKQLAAQIKTLEAENVTLKEDLAFFESLLPNAIGPQGISIRRLKLDQVAPNQLRYRLLIMQGGKGEQTFLGTLQLVASTLQDGKSAMMVFPNSSAAEQEKFKLRFRYYQRVEGVLTLPEGVSVQTVQARVLEKDQVRAQQSANL
jgi:primosomal protein N'